jgi:tetratricopeptide (TPR) repeat protein
MPAPVVVPAPPASRPDTVKPPVPEETPAPQLGYKELVELARKQRRSQPEKALSLIDKALEIQPQGGKALVLKAELLLDRNNSDAAMAVTERALSADSANAEAWRTKGKILLGVDSDGAKFALQKYLELRPNAADADQIRSAIDSL